MEAQHFITYIYVCNKLLVKIYYKIAFHSIGVYWPFIARFELQTILSCQQPEMLEKNVLIDPHCTRVTLLERKHFKEIASLITWHLHLPPAKHKAFFFWVEGHLELVSEASFFFQSSGYDFPFCSLICRHLEICDGELILLSIWCCSRLPGTDSVSLHKMSRTLI